MSVWYEACVSQEDQIRQIIVRGNLDGAKRAVETLRQGWPDFDMIFVRQHRKLPCRERILHSLTIKRGAPEVTA